MTTRPEPNDSSQTWHPWTRIAFRFCVVYFGIYVLTTQMVSGFIPIPGLEIPELHSLPPLRNLYLFVGAHVLGIGRTIAYQSSGSSDKTFDWVQCFTLLLIAAIATAIWTARATRRPHHERTFAWFRLFMRFALGTTMMTYGLVKAFPLQMATLRLNSLVEPFGNFSPMGVLWGSIGAAPAYEMFVGFAELGAGVLLFWPRTATLGALLCLMDTIEVFTLNMTYDVPVKLFSLHLVLMSLFLLAPNLGRLFELVILHRTTSLRAEPPVGRSATARRNAVVAQVAFGALVLLIGTYDRSQTWKSRGSDAPKSPLFGIWDVEAMTVDGELRPPLLTDSTRWRRLTFQLPTYVTFHRPNDNFQSYGAAIDTNAKTLTLSDDSAKTKWSLSYARPSHERLLIDGTMEGHAIHLEMAFRDPDSFLQRSRGFRWISEVPFNR